MKGLGNFPLPALRSSVVSYGRQGHFTNPSKGTQARITLGLATLLGRGFRAMAGEAQKDEAFQTAMPREQIGPEILINFAVTDTAVKTIFGGYNDQG